ncbi:unnamed protein product, partial [Brassica napus]
ERERERESCNTRRSIVWLCYCFVINIDIYMSFTLYIITYDNN